MHGTTGKILQVDLSTGTWEIETLSEAFYRLYPGGKALAGYILLNEMPANVDPLSPENVRGAMRRAYSRAGFPPGWTGSHLLRHTAATMMLNRGASLKELADVLGHQSIDTTMIYTKVHIAGLQMVMLPWPEVQS